MPAVAWRGGGDNGRERSSGSVVGRVGALDGAGRETGGSASSGKVWGRDAGATGATACGCALAWLAGVETGVAAGAVASLAAVTRRAPHWSQKVAVSRLTALQLGHCVGMTTSLSPGSLAGGSLQGSSENTKARLLSRRTSR